SGESDTARTSEDRAMQYECMTESYSCQLRSHLPRADLPHGIRLADCAETQRAAGDSPALRFSDLSRLESGASPTGFVPYRRRGDRVLRRQPIRRCLRPTAPI